MTKDTNISKRKDDHIRINLEEDVNSSLSTGLEKFQIIHQALPEISLSDVDMSQELFGKVLPVPLLISSMTGGTDQADQINRNLATAAQEIGCCMAVGSQRAAIENPKVKKTFNIRKYAPGILGFANIGAVQLNYGYGVDQCQKAVDMIEADALVLHLNPLQEALQLEGNSNFSNLAKKIAEIKKSLNVPLIVKEVGWGISRETAKRLLEAGVDAIDVAGAGGTSWSQVEMHRMKDPYQAQTAAAFRDWGIPTAISIENARWASEDWLIFASGGLRTGVDIAKCLALGATLGGMAGVFLKAANQNLETTINVMKMIVDQIRIAMFATGSKDLKALNRDNIQERN
ncbi:MAG: type 2 isopentenyl-diphosphate Delta-isomerase [Brevefilum sp.]|nr:type 2 isopentenyl-diphosphate Delta-isomerase [Brevefilum sp.]MDW7755178.1 type 2 isopentenyl-diphosphate Delta-isomerase [Brevefilum sp.]